MKNAKKKELEVVEAEKVIEDEEELTSDIKDEEEMEEEVLEELEEETEDDDDDEESEDEEEDDKYYHERDNKFVKLFKDNVKPLLFLIVGVIIGVIIMFILWPERIAKLSDGTEVVAKYGDVNITANQLYGITKKQVGLNAILEVVDTAILNGMYDVAEDAAKYADEQSKQYLEYYVGSLGYSEAEFYENVGIANKADLIDYLKKDYVRKLYFEEYVKDSVTDKEIKNVYNKYAFGKVKKLYIFFSESSDASLKKIEKELKNGKSYADVEDKYDDVQGMEMKDASFSDIYVTYSNALCEKIRNTKSGNTVLYTDKDLGKVLIYVEGNEKLGSLEDEKSSILEAIAGKKENEDEKLYEQSLIALRKKNGLTFSDTELKDAYNKYLKQYE